MTAVQMISGKIKDIPENQLIFANELYSESFRNRMTKNTFSQAIGKLCKGGILCRIAKEIYYRPKAGRYGLVPPSQKEIVSAFTQPDIGVVIGHALYNELKLTTQVPKTIVVLSSNMDQQTKRVGNVQLRFCNLSYTPEVKRTVHMLEVLQNFDEIQDLNYNQFIHFCEEFAPKYDEKVFEQIIQQTHYQKRTISFLKAVLDHYRVQNVLGKYLSPLSDYKHPSMDKIIEATRVPE